jgi:glycosyltransferase involved in cell wall biosynthesis
MNVLHINQSDIAGGAAIAAYRLHQGLLRQGVDSKLLVGTVKTSSERVASTPRKRHLDKLMGQMTSRFGLNYVNHLGTLDIFKHPFFLEADVLHFHNLHYEQCFGYFNYLALPQLTKRKPAIFTLHDMWSFTGHCAYSYDCDRWKIGCGHCPYPALYPAIRQDSTAWEWKLKNWTYNRSNLRIVADSQWLAEQAQQSMLKHFPIHHIPYGIDTEAYQPLNREHCKSILGLTNTAHVLLFGATSLKDRRKGGDLLLAVLQGLPETLKANLALLTLGDGGDTIAKSAQLPIINLGYVTCDRIKSMAYSAADLFLFPTRADAFGLVAQEAAACGTPTVAFNVGGVSDMVRPGITGYLAEPENVNDFRNGILNLLNDHALRTSMNQQCREIILREYPLELQAQRYLHLYEQA